MGGEASVMIQKETVFFILVYGTVAFFAISGYKRGLVKLVISLVSMILTAYLVFSITPEISDFLVNETRAYEVVKDGIDSALEGKNSERDNTIYENQIVTIDSYGMPGRLKKALKDNNNEDTYNTLLVSVFEDYVSGFIARLCIKIMAFFSTFIVVMLVLKMTFLSMEFISSIPVISTINRIFGLFFGFIEGLIVVSAVFLILSIAWGKGLLELVSGNYILEALYDNNLLLAIFLS